MTINADMRNVFMSAMDGFCQAERVPVLFPNVEEPRDHKFSEDVTVSVRVLVNVLTIPPVSDTLCGGCGGVDYKWILQLRVQCRDGVGEDPAMEIADKLASYLMEGAEFQGAVTYTVTDSASPGPALPGEGYYTVPVSCRIEATT